MSPVNITDSRFAYVYLAKVADQAERYNDVIEQLKKLISFANAQLTVDERNLLSIAYKNVTATLRSSWRAIDTLQKIQGPSSTRSGGALREIPHPRCRPWEEKVFYCKMRGDYYRYLAEISRPQSYDQYATTSLDAYKFAYKHAIITLDPTHPTRLGLALNFAVYFHDIVRSPDRACHLAKHAFDEAVATMIDPSFAEHSLEDSFMILQLLKDDLILWSGEMEA
ncbi:DNA damage checkpoint protein rad25 [Grifola frondosa]|uniref:DNA damage checkpoint protein rad25 n=1 Tax=Grifola frondosa TaxID=5627 RepID=A0A1C7MJN6_GRIFR|nr:DNA damage checkpoint protein rad25 [Grifola frondosa]